MSIVGRIDSPGAIRSRACAVRSWTKRSSGFPASTATASSRSKVPVAPPVSASVPPSRQGRQAARSGRNGGSIARPEPAAGGSGGPRRRGRDALGEVLAVDDPALARRPTERMGDRHSLTLVRLRAGADRLPPGFAVLDPDGASARRRDRRSGRQATLSRTCTWTSDPRPASARTDVGRTLRLGPRVTIAVLERDARCKMITIDPETAEPSGAILRQVSRAHDGMAGVLRRAGGGHGATGR